MTQVDYSKADTIVSATDGQRADSSKKGAFSSGRSSALMGSDTSKTDTSSKNVVEDEMNAQEVEDRFSPIFEQLHEAVDAAEEACHKLVEGVQLEQEQDKQLVKVLDDLAAVVQNTRDSRNDLMSEVAPSPDANTPEPLKQ